MLAASWQRAGIRVSLFINAEREQIDAAREAGAPAIEIHTGAYADARARARNSKSSSHRIAKPRTMPPGWG